MKKLIKPDIYEYLDYRVFLSDIYTTNKESDSRFSYRSLAQKVNFKSQSTFLMIVKGQRNLSLKAASMVSKGLKFSKNEFLYFERLISFNDEQEEEKKKKLYIDLIGLRDKTALNYLQKTQFRVLSSWYYLAIYVLIGTGKFKKYFNFSDSLNGQISREQASKALNDLLEIGLVVENGNGLLQQSNGAMTTDDTIKTKVIKKYHENMIKKSLESLLVDDSEIRNFNGVTFSIPRDKYSIIVDKIRDFRKDINEITSSLEESKDVYHLTLNLFPLTKVTE